MKNFLQIILLSFSIALSNEMFGQIIPEYDMSDTTLTDCKGILYDSGGDGGLYGNNENLTTVIQTGGVINIVFTGVFTVEPGLDFLYIYDGPNATFPLIGQYSGTTLPPSLTANNGAITLVFTSDNSAVYAGFIMEWETIVPPPVPPTIDVPALPDCNQALLEVHWSYNLYCEWVNAATFTVLRQGEELEILGVAPFCPNDSTPYAVIALADPFTTNCTYQVQIEISIPDICGTFYPFILTTEFTVSSCSIDGEITATEPSICPGNCSVLEFETLSCLGQTYSWSNGLPATAGPHTVCPAVTTTYQLTVTEESTGVVELFEYTIEVLSTSITTLDQTICQSIPAFELEAAVEGVWEGPGIQDEVTGLFEPDSAFAGVNTIYFESAGCLDSVLITIEPISTDNTVAACPGTAPFQLNALPLGGVWDGPFTTTAGLFDPSTQGSYVVYYDVNGCRDSVDVNVFDITGSFTFDTICQSVWTDTLEFSPLGGYWQGAGILDSLLGIYAPAGVPAGDASFTYIINGCQQTYTGFVKEIFTGESFHTACPLEDPQVFYTEPFTPTGGEWIGPGIIDPVTGLFDPGAVGDDTFNGLIYYAPNGCSDTTFIYVKQTEIGLDTLWMCSEDDLFFLYEDDALHNPAYGGQWTGTGIGYNGGEDWFFSPSISGVGSFTVYYTKNTCVDSLPVVVFPSELNLPDDIMCSNEPPVWLGAGIQEGGTWSGSGITEQTLGWFDPAQANVGGNMIYWTTPAGCEDSLYIEVEAFDQAAIAGVESFYCYLDSNYVFSVSPADGVISGATDTLTFNPITLGAGTFEIIYTYTGMVCSSADTVSFEVYPELTTTIDVTETIICDGSTSTITVTANGGNPNVNYTYEWSDGAFPVNTNTVDPLATTTYIVTTSDGCSEPVVDEVEIQVYPPIDFDVIISDTLCFGEEGFAQASANGIGPFEFSWNGQAGPSIAAEAGEALELLIIDQSTGCDADTVVFLPSYPPIIANFSINPNLECIDYDERENVQIIDFSQNAVTGTWDLGGGVFEPYVLGTTPSLSYASAGQFTVTLIVENVGGCSDSSTVSICILPADPTFIPDIFSPNGDGNNDIFYVRGRGIIELDFRIYNRFGQQVFRSTNASVGWDGTQGGKPMPSGSYVYSAAIKLADGTSQDVKGEVTLIR